MPASLRATGCSARHGTQRSREQRDLGIARTNRSTQASSAAQVSLPRSLDCLAVEGRRIRQRQLARFERSLRPSPACFPSLPMQLTCVMLFFAFTAYCQLPTCSSSCTIRSYFPSLSQTQKVVSGGQRSVSKQSGILPRSCMKSTGKLYSRRRLGRASWPSGDFVSTATAAAGAV